MSDADYTLITRPEGNPPLHLHDIINPTDLDRALTDKLVKTRPSGDGLTIYNYTDAAMWTPGAWDNPAVRACRGLIIHDITARVVARPWAKFFNHGQTEAGALDMDSPVEVTDKLDGSLGIIHPRPDGTWAVATRGSFTSDQAVHATAILDHYTFDHIAAKAWTLLVEIVYPGNRIVCDYGDRDELVLLGAVHVDTGKAIGPHDAVEVTGWNGPTTDTFNYPTLAAAIAAPPRPGAEGFVVRYLNAEGQRLVKIKQADYVALHRIVTGLSEKTVWQHAMDGRPLHELLTGVPDELHGWIGDVWHNLRSNVDVAVSEVDGIYNSIMDDLDDVPTRKDFAIAVQNTDLEDPRYRAMLFLRHDGRDVAAAALKTLKPVGDTRAKTITEDVA